MLSLHCLAAVSKGSADAESQDYSQRHWKPLTRFSGDGHGLRDKRVCTDV